MAQANKNYRKVTFDELKQTFIDNCQSFGLFSHSESFGYTPDEAFKTYLSCWKKQLIRNGIVTRQAFDYWKKRGWIDEDMRSHFMVYCFGNRYKKAKG